MTEVVLDASLFLAAISPAEVHHASAKTLFDRHPEDRPFLVPSLFRVEVLAALSRRGESRELIDTVDVVVSGLRFHAVPIDAAQIDSAAHIARSARLRAYDAVYVALARESKAALWTLDRKMKSRVATALPTVKVVVPS